MRDMSERVYAPRNKCIYCGVAYDPLVHPNGFSKEHIIPESIGGRFVALRAVCPECRELTSDTYEKHTIKTIFRIPRILLGIKRKNQKKKEKAGNSLKLPQVAIGKFSTEVSSLNYELELEQLRFPQIFCLPKFLPSGFLCPPANDGPPKYVYKILISLGNSQQLPKEGIAVKAEFNFFNFGMTLEKLAFSYAVCEGLDKSVDLTDLQDLIFERRTDVYNFVGSFKKSENIAKELHKLSYLFVQDLAIVRVHLFSCCTTQSYMVVVGKKKKPSTVRGYIPHLPEATSVKYSATNDSGAFHMNLEQPNEVDKVQRFVHEIVSDLLQLPAPSAKK
jgi:hypothetical protein